MNLESIVGRCICGTGHRPSKLSKTYSEWDSKIEAKLTIALIEIFKRYKPSKVISGMALGWDTVLARAAASFPDIFLELHIPCKGQSKKWSKSAQHTYEGLCEKADRVVILSEEYTPKCMQERNESMVDAADIVLALWDGSKGGTGNCIRYAQSRDVPIVNLWSKLMDKPEQPSFIDPDIVLREEDHTYLYKGEDIGFTSATTLLHKLYPPFIPEKVAKSLLKYPKYKGRTVKDILEEWEETNKVGSLVHWELEQYVLSRREPTHYRAKLGREWLDKLFARDKYNFYPEVILYVKDLKVCGTTDLVLEEKDTGHLHVMDYKCIRKLRFKSFDKEYGIHPITAHLMNCNFVIYSLQLSLYRYILEVYHNKKVWTNNLVHIREQDVKVYRCQYHKGIIERIFKSIPELIS